MRDLTGYHSGKLIGIKDVGASNDGHRLWVCQCDCGNTTIVQSNNLYGKGVLSCGCARVEHCKSDKMRKRASETQRGRPKSEETRKRLSEALKGRPTPEPYRSILVARMKASCGENNVNWRGGVSYDGYCRHFNEEIKEEIRNKFSRRCFICGMTEGSRKLDVHHVDYNKGQGCGHKWNLIALCHSCHTRTTNVRYYYFNLLSNYWIYQYGECDLYDRLERLP